MSMTGRSRIPLAIRTNQHNSSPSSSSTYDSARSHLSPKTVTPRFSSVASSPGTKLPQPRSSPAKPISVQDRVIEDVVITPDQVVLLRRHGLPLNTITEQQSASTVNKPLPKLPTESSVNKPLPSTPVKTAVSPSVKDDDGLTIQTSPMPGHDYEKTSSASSVPPALEMDLKTMDMCKTIDALWKPCGSLTPTEHALAAS